ncbi:PAS domain-containing protein [Sediminicola sp. 1XM1-17]|uniref:PAS domain-containing protein n=1 Tax=Sediminicola sp. 1XM1-17 TaxID=3127702 RepID=UPI003077444A
MKTEIIKSLIEFSPNATAILDNDLRFIRCSKVLRNEYGLREEHILGKKFLEVFPFVPDNILNTFELSLYGDISTNLGHEYMDHTGQLKKLLWKANPWKDSQGANGGIIISVEEISRTYPKKAIAINSEDNSLLGGWEIITATCKIYWTSVTKTILEVPFNFEPTLDNTLLFYKEGTNRERISSAIMDALNEGLSWSEDFQVTTANGRDIWIRTTGKAEMLEGKCVRIFGTIKDITQRKTDEIRYLETIQRLEIANDAAEIGIWDYDIASDTAIWDSNMYRLFGIKEEDFSSTYQAYESIIHPDDRDHVDQHLAMAIAGERAFDTSFRILWPNGNIRHIRAIGKVLKSEDGKPVRVVGTNWDFTELRNTKLKLTSSEESFQGAFENSAMGIAIVAVDGKWIDVNDSICQGFGYSKKEFLQMTFQDITHPQDLEKDLNLLNEVVAGKREGYQMEKRYFHKNGSIIYAVLTVSAIKNIDGKLSHFISQIMDITSRIEAEKEAKLLYEITKNQNDSLLNFAHIVSHNLRSHAANLSMLIDFLSQEENEEEKKQIVRLLANSAGSLNETILHLSDVVQTKTQSSNDLKDINIHERIKSVEKTLSAVILEKKVSCSIDIPKDLQVRALPAYLDSILLNLFTNAIRYSSPNRLPKITITSELKEDHFTLVFQDNGLGIDLKKHGKKIFGMYKTFHKHKDAKGIGLFITKNQVEAMNGKISVASLVDQGTTFRVTLMVSQKKKNLVKA